MKIKFLAKSSDNRLNVYEVDEWDDFYYPKSSLSNVYNSSNFLIVKGIWCKQYNDGYSVTYFIDTDKQNITKGSVLDNCLKEALAIRRDQLIMKLCESI